MPTEHKKRKAKKEKTLTLINVKSEPNVLHPLEHYVDDRVELVRQIFSSLKTKTINSIVPDFLQKKSHEDLQEICLEELLGISKKRLTSIINATKCPTDTESSDSETSDVENIEEHISLEEISSDSNDELNKPKKGKKHSVKSAKKNAATAAATAAASTAKASEPKTSAAGANGNSTGEKQYSILELLELQARARAIRSQLALEPVTKIELYDSDDEVADTNKEPVPVKPAKEIPANDKNEVQMNVSNDDTNSPTKEVQESVKATPKSTEELRLSSSRPIRLKRNFRPRQIDDEDISMPATEEIEKNVEKSPAKSPEKIAGNTNGSDIAAQDEAAPAVNSQNDDDIIPIIAEPEILCITSSDSENEDAKFLNKVKRSYITMPTVEKEIRPPTEDELFLERVKQKTSIEPVVKQCTDKCADESSSKTGQIEKDRNDQQPVGETSVNAAKVVEEEEEAPEDGEIVEDEPIEIFTVVADVVDLAESSDDETESNAKTCDSVTEETQSDVQEEVIHEKTIEEKPFSKDSAPDTDEENSTDLGGEKVAEQSKRSDDVSDEDIIDLGKDEDLDFEIKNDAKPEPNNESWDTRWLRNNKVTKVLATAKLASKVRSKIKEKRSKTAAEAVPTEDANELIVETPIEIPTNVEVGSVEHYKELTKKK